MKKGMELSLRTAVSDIQAARRIDERERNGRTVSQYMKYLEKVRALTNKEEKEKAAKEKEKVEREGGEGGQGRE